MGLYAFSPSKIQLDGDRQPNCCTYSREHVCFALRWYTHHLIAFDLHHCHTVQTITGHKPVGMVYHHLYACRPSPLVWGKVPTRGSSPCWPCQDECLASYLEKRQIDPNYVLGACPGINPSEYWMPAILHNRLLLLLIPTLYHLVSPCGCRRWIGEAANATQRARSHAKESHGSVCTTLHHRVDRSDGQPYTLFPSVKPRACF